MLSEDMEEKLLIDHLPSQDSLRKCDMIVQHIQELETSWIELSEAIVTSLNQIQIIIPNDTPTAEAKVRFNEYFNELLCVEINFRNIVLCMMHVRVLIEEARKDNNAVRAAEILDWFIQYEKDKKMDGYIHSIGGWHQFKHVSVRDCRANLAIAPPEIANAKRAETPVVLARCNNPRIRWTRNIIGATVFWGFLGYLVKSRYFSGVVKNGRR